MTGYNNTRFPGAKKSKKAKSSSCFRYGSQLGCLFFLGLGYLVFLISSFLLGVYLFAPFPTNLVLLGIDYTKPSNFIGRSDTIMLISFDPGNRSIDMLSIPRDLWITIPGVGENRINTAHFFAEAQEEGTGPGAVMNILRQSFGFNADYYIRIRFESFRQVVDAMGGIDIQLDEPMAGYPSGTHHLNGRKALAFVRHRKGSDDFFRMERSQFLLQAAIENLKNPVKWARIPSALYTMYQSVDSNIPISLWPRMIFLMLKNGGQINNRTISRDMVTPFSTNQGASVLLPDWVKIGTLIEEMFGH